MISDDRDAPRRGGGAARIMGNEAPGGAATPGIEVAGRSVAARRALPADTGGEPAGAAGPSPARARRGIEAEDEPTVGSVSAARGRRGLPDEPRHTHAGRRSMPVGDETQGTDRQAPRRGVVPARHSLPDDSDVDDDTDEPDDDLDDDDEDGDDEDEDGDDEDELPAPPLSRRTLVASPAAAPPTISAATAPREAPPVERVGAGPVTPLRPAVGPPEAPSLATAAFPAAGADAAADDFPSVRVPANVGLRSLAVTPPSARPVSPTPAPGSSSPRRRRFGTGRLLPLVAGFLIVVLTLVGVGLDAASRRTATASSGAASAVPTPVPRVVSLAPGTGRPAELESWLVTKGFVCTAEGTTSVDGRLCLLSGPNQTTVYVGGSTTGLGRVAMVTPYDPSPLSQEVQDQLLAATLASPADVAAVKAALAGGTLEKPAGLTLGSLTVKGSIGRQLVITADGWPGLTPPGFPLTEATFADLGRQSGYACTEQTGVIECSRAIGQMQLNLSAFTGTDHLRYVRLRVTGSDRTVVQQALVSEALSLLPTIGDAGLAEAFRVQAANAGPHAFSGPYLLDYYPATTSGNTVRATLYVGQSCWTGVALTC